MQFRSRHIQQEQDEHIEEIHSMAVRMKKTGQDINSELQHQNQVIQ